MLTISRGLSYSGLLALLALIALCNTSPASITLAAGSPAGSASPAAADTAQHDGVLSLPDGQIELLAGAPPPPPLFSAYNRYGVYHSATRSLATPTARFRLTYQATLPAGSVVRIDLRGSVDGVAWSEWAAELASGATVELPVRARYVQYRVTLLAAAQGLPSVAAIAIEPLAAPATYQAAESAEPIAPTFRLRATRQGMVGGRTANGYIIEPRARFVSLPSWRALSPRGSYDYSVRITYQGRSAVAPVWDVGPYNTRDDYWSFERERYKELPRGWSQDHAAYYEGHNGGRAEKGYVHFPTAIDIGDGIWWDELKINGDQAEVEVTFLWLGRDPLAGKIQRPLSAGELIVDELGPDFWRNTPVWERSPVGCGEGRHAFATASVAAIEQSVHVARWQPILPVEGLYDLYVHVPICPAKRPPSLQARYLIQHRDAALEVGIDQSRQTGWLLLGRFPFAAGDAGYLQLSDVSGENGRTIWFDQAKWVLVE